MIKIRVSNNVERHEGVFSTDTTVNEVFAHFEMERSGNAVHLNGVSLDAEECEMSIGSLLDGDEEYEIVFLTAVKKADNA